MDKDELRTHLLETFRSAFGLATSKTLPDLRPELQPTEWTAGYAVTRHGWGHGSYPAEYSGAMPRYDCDTIWRQPNIYSQAPVWYAMFKTWRDAIAAGKPPSTAARLAAQSYTDLRREKQTPTGAALRYHIEMPAYTVRTRIASLVRERAVYEWCEQHHYYDVCVRCRWDPSCHQPELDSLLKRLAQLRQNAE